jgi:hypothetical protein
VPQRKSEAKKQDKQYKPAPPIERNDMECEHGQLARACNICEYEREIAELKATLTSGVLKDHDSCLIYQDEEYTKLEIKYNNLEDKLSRLTALIESDERAEKEAE